MSRVRSLLRFVWDFVVGDDWRIAAGVVFGLGATALLASADVSAWWMMPVIAALLLAYSVSRAAR